MVISWVRQVDGWPRPVCESPVGAVLLAADAGSALTAVQRTMDTVQRALYGVQCDRAPLQEGAALTEQPSDEEEVRLVLDVLDSLEQLDDPAERARRAGKLLAAWPEQHTRLREIRQAAVVAMRAQNVSYRKIAQTLGISLARVQQIEAGERGKRGKLAEGSPAE
jgi:DNA-directed RNA polymerase specialized sigma24 family protein